MSPEENLPLEFRRLSVNSIQFFETMVVRIPLTLPLPQFNRIVSHLSLTEYRIGEDVGFGSGILISSTVQEACRHPPQILETNHACASGFWLTTDQLFCFPEKLSRIFPMMIPLHILNSLQSLFREEPLLEEWYSRTFSKKPNSRSNHS